MRRTISSWPAAVIRNLMRKEDVPAALTAVPAPIAAGVRTVPMAAAAGYALRTHRL